MRIATLLPSATEIVAALGAGEALVAVSHECNAPAFVSSLPRATSSRFDPAQLDHDAAAIDAAVKESVGSSSGIYAVDGALLASLEPDVIVTQAQCDVCAVALADVERACAEHEALRRARIVALAPGTLADVLADIRTVAEAIGVDPAPLLDSLAARRAALEAETEGAPSPTVACVEWSEPLMVAANWMPGLVEIAGGRHSLTTDGQPTRRTELAELLAFDPEVLVVMPCGFQLEAAIKDARQLLARRELAGLRALHSGRVFAVDGDHYFNRAGPRLIDSAEILAHLLHPERSPDRHPEAWRQLASLVANPERPE